MSDLKVYAIPNCNTVKKALDWLKAKKIAYEFHDYKKLGITSAILTSWCTQVGWEALVNKKGATWRQLPPEVQAQNARLAMPNFSPGDAAAVAANDPTKVQSLEALQQIERHLRTMGGQR